MGLIKKDISQMETGGVFDYWNRLTIFIREFVERNYPLSKQDMKSITDDNFTDNVVRRQSATKAMQDKLHEIVAREFKSNKHKTEDFSQAQQSNGVDEKLVAFQQEILEAHWNEMSENHIKEESVFTR